MPGVRVEIHGSPISLVLWRDDLAIGLAAYVIIEIEKWLHRKVDR